MTDPLYPIRNCHSFILPYPPEVEKKTGSAGMSFPFREHYLLFARQSDDTDPQEAAHFRELASYYPDVIGGEMVYRDSRGNLIAEEDDWDDLTDEQKIHRGNVYAAIDVVNRIRSELESCLFEYGSTDDVTRVRCELAAISV
jgi:hypothetical protein